MHIQTSGTTKPSTVAPSVFESKAPPTSDASPVDRAGFANSVGGPSIPPTPTLGAPAVNLEAGGPGIGLGLVHYAKSYRPFELFVNENYKL